MPEDKAREIVANIEDLPTLPEVVIEITRLVESPDASADDIYRIVSTDVSLSATMLKLVNSAFYGMSKSVTSLDKAIKILGFSTVRNIALAAFVFDAFLTGKGRFNYKGFWLHSIGTAAAAGVIARRLKVKEVGEYFVYGLLHSLGTVVLMQYMPEEFAKVRKLVDAGRRADDAAVEVCGCTQAHIGEALAQKWDFPADLVAVIGHHWYNDLPAAHAREVAVTVSADAVASAMAIGEGSDPRMPVVRPAVWQEAGVDVADLGPIMDEVAAEMDKSRSFVDILYR